MRGLRVLLLGRPRLEFDGQPLTRLMALKQQALVFHLAAEGGPLARSRLAALLWGEVDEAAARASLRVALTRLRRWLPGMLDIDDRQVDFAAGAPLSVDLRELEAALDPQRPPALRRAAAQGWRGPLLDGFDLGGSDDFERWLAQARQRAARAAGALRRDLLQRCEAAGALDEAVEHARALLDIDDADEPAHMALMRLLAAGGRRTAAIAQYEACRAALAERLGARPSADCYALYRRIHADAPMPAAQAEPHREPHPGPYPEPHPEPRPEPHPEPRLDAGGAALVGRGAELALLRQRLADPECRWLTITGPGGAGKTRLAQAAADELGPRFRHGALWFSGRDEGGALRDAETLAQQVLEHIGSDRQRPGALLLVLDNLETVPEARALAPLLGSRVPGATVLATSRGRVGGSREWLLELGGLSLARAAGDRPASSPAAALFAARARRLAPAFDAVADAQAIEHICSLVGGLPLALEMAAHAVHRDGTAAVAARLAAGAPLVDPERDRDDRHHSIDVVLQDAWALLDERSRDAALRLAALPGEADAALAAAMGVDGAALALLRDQSWLQRGEGGRFAMHPLQQEHLRRRPEAAAQAAAVRAALGQHLLRQLPEVEPFGDLAPADAARAGALAGAAAFAAPVLAQAAAQLCDDAPAEALAEWMDRATALLAALDRQAEAAALLAHAAARTDLPAWRAAGWQLRRAELLNGAGASAAAQRAYVLGLRRLGLGELDADAVPLRQTLRSLSRVARLRGWPPRAHPAHAPFTRLLLRSLLFLSAMLVFTPQPQPMLRASALAGVLARRSRGPGEREATRTIDAWGAALFGHPRLARWLAAPLQARPRVAAHPRLDLSAAHGHAALRVAIGPWRGLGAELDASAAAWRALHATRHEMEARSLAAKLAFYEGRLHEAWQRFADISELSLHRPGDAWRAWGPFGQAEVALCLGEPDSAAVQRLLERGAQLMTEMENIDAAYTLRRLGLGARLAWLRGDAAAAREAVLTGVAAAARIRYCGFWAHEGFVGIGETLLALRDHERRRGGALPPLDEAWAALQPALAAHVRRFPPAATVLARLRGSRRLADGDAAGARRQLQRAVALAERQGMRVELARACQALTRVERGAYWSERARSLWQDMGAHAGAPG